MPRLRRARVNNRRRRELQRNLMNPQRQVVQAPQGNNDPPVIAAVNQLADLQLQNPIGNEAIVQGVIQPVLPEDDDIIHIQFPAPHCLGDMHNRCPHCAARYFQQECTTRGVFTKCCFQGKVTLPVIAVPPHNIVVLFSGDTAHSRHFWKTFVTIMLQCPWHLGMQH